MGEVHSLESATQFVVRVYDNLHYMDDDESYEAASFESYEDALSFARSIVESQVAHVKFDYKAYTGFGEDAAVTPTPFGFEPFSGWDYAKKLCEAHSAQVAN